MCCRPALKWFRASAKGGAVLRLSVEDVSSVATLARLALAEEEKQRLAGHLNEIIEHFARLQELDTADVEPTDRVLPMVNVYREDSVRPSLSREAVLAGVPEASDAAFLVPRVVDTADGQEPRPAGPGKTTR